MNTKILAIAIAVALTIQYFLIPTTDIEAAFNSYCEYVEIWNNTNGRYGHPNFKNLECN